MQLSTFTDEENLSVNKKTWISPIKDLIYIRKKYLSQLSDFQNNKQTIILNIVLNNSLKLKVGILSILINNNYMKNIDLNINSSLRQIIDLSLCLRSGGIEYVILIYKNKYSNQFLNTVKYLEKFLYGYIDLLLIYDNNVQNVTEVNCELKRYHHQLSSSRSRDGEEDGEEGEGGGGGDSNETVAFTDNDGDGGSTTNMILPVVALSDNGDDDKIRVIRISRRNDFTTIQTNIITYHI